MTNQTILRITTRGRHCTAITDDIATLVESSSTSQGLAHIFVRHTSCSLVLTENADPDVRHDLETLFARLFPDGDSQYRHRFEGADDMAAHARSIVAGTEATVPVRDGKLLLGTWQGIYVWEHRYHSHAREVVVTLIGS